MVIVTQKESYCLKRLRLSSLGGAHVEMQCPERDTKEFGWFKVISQSKTWMQQDTLYCVE